MPDPHERTILNPSPLIPCRHLDYTQGKFGPDIELETCAPHYPHVRYWRRGAVWLDCTAQGNTRPPEKVQFCGAGRGRINGIFQCYNGELSCYEPRENTIPVGLSSASRRSHHMTPSLKPPS